METFADALKRFIEYLQEIMDTENFTFPVKIHTKHGKKYIKVIREYAGQNAAYCFIDTETGNIYKPAGWKAPEKNHVRGNIFSNTYIDWCNPYTINNIR